MPSDTEQERQQLQGVLAAWAKRLEAAKWRRSLHWFRNYAFLCGNHYPNFRWNGDSLQMNVSTFDQSASVSGARASVDQYVPKVADNQIIRAYEFNVSKLCELRPEPRVQPNSDSPADDDASRLAEIAYRVKYEDLAMQGKLRDIAGHVSVCGTAAAEITFDDIDQIVETVRMKQVEEPDPLDPSQTRKRYQPTDQTDASFEEDLVARVWSAFHLSPDPAATNDPSSLSWIRRANYEDLSWIREMFDRQEPGFHADALERMGENAFTNTSLYWWEQLKDLLDSPDSAYGMAGKSLASTGGNCPNQSVLAVWDCKPNLRFPRGRTLVTGGDMLIYSGDARAWSEKYKFRWHPYSFFRYWTLPGRFWGIPLLSALVPLQKRLNAIDSLVQINREYMTLGQWLVPTACKVPEGMFGGEPGKTIPYRITPTGSKPERVPHVGLPQELLAERQILSQRIEVNAGMRQSNEVAAGSALRSGTMLDFYERERQKSQSSMLQAFAESHESLARNMLIEISLNFTTNDNALTRRLAAAAANQSQQAIKTFVGSDLRDNVHVRVDIASALMKTPEAEKELAVQFLQARGQKITDEESATIWEKIGFADFDKQQGPQVARAKRMIARVAEGNLEAAFALPADNPQIMLAVLGTTMISDKFNDYSMEAKKAILGLWDQYQSMISQQQQSQMMNQLQMTAMMALAQQGAMPKPMQPALDAQKEEQKQGDTESEPAGEAQKETVQ